MENYDVLRETRRVLESVSEEEPSRHGLTTSQSPHMQRYEVEMKERLHAIASLRDLVVQQKKTITSLKQKQTDYRKTMLRMQRNRSQLSLEDISEEISSIVSELGDEDPPNISGQNTTPRKRLVSFGRPSERMDEDVISALTCESDESFSVDGARDNGGDYHQAIAAIQEQASQIDTVIALDKLETAETDLEAARNELKRRAKEVDELQEQVSRIETRLASVELERDLFEAEAKRSKEDLKTCIQHMASRHFSQQPYDAETKAMAMQIPSRHSRVVVTPTSKPVATAFPENTRRRPPSTDDEERAEDSSGGEQFEVAATTAETANSMSDGEMPSGWASSPSSETTGATSDDISADLTESNASRAPLLPSSYARSGARSPAIPSEPRTSTLGLCFWRQRNRGVADGGPAFVQMDDDASKRKWTPQKKYGTGQKKPGKASSAKETAKSRPSALSERIDQLNTKMAVAHRSADELRMHLSSITRYYDNTVYSLQQNVGSLRSGQDDIAADEYTSDMIGQLSLLDHQKRVAMEKLRKTEASIDQLRMEKEVVLGGGTGSNPSIPLQRKKKSVYRK